jgi:hypothetical protein
MQISLWQQFASNHSSGFTIIGEFTSAEDAQHAAAELKSVFETITSWHDSHKEESDMILAAFWNQPISDSMGTMQVTLAEIELGRQYQIEWIEGIDWFSRADTAILLDRYVYVSPKSWVEEYSAIKPIVALMQHLGSAVRFDFRGEYGLDRGNPISIELKCTAPNETTGQIIYDSVHSYFEGTLKTTPPWITYPDGEQHPQAEEITRLTTSAPNISKLPLEQMGLLIYTRYGLMAEKGTIERDGLNLRFMNLDFGIPCPHGRGLRALIAWLKDQNCSNFQLKLW